MGKGPSEGETLFGERSLLLRTSVTNGLVGKGAIFKGLKYVVILIRIKVANVLGGFGERDSRVGA